MPIADKRAMAGCVACGRSGVLRLESVRVAQGRRRDEQRFAPLDFDRKRSSAGLPPDLDNSVCPTRSFRRGPAPGTRRVKPLVSAAFDG
jgi:hypothetical protein